MGKIAVLDKNTIDKIAAGEVIERPSSVVKELTENAIDAGASIITVELKDGGCSLIRVTDNGCGMEKADVRTAFFSHATSKIRTVEDLLTADSLGFRGEALPSIASVANVEMITKTSEAFTGTRYRIEGGEEKGLDDVGCPDGTTFLIKDLFYNVPARKKFLKSAMTETGYCSELLERIALCNSRLSFRFINNGKVVFQTSGNGQPKDCAYQLFGREFATNSIELSHTEPLSNIQVNGLVGKPVLVRGNRSYEIYFVNGRYIRNSTIQRAIEEAYRPYIMQHRYPFCVLSIFMDASTLDVNVHPAKLEVRFSDAEAVYYAVYHAVKEALANVNMTVPMSLATKQEDAARHQEGKQGLGVKGADLVRELYQKPQTPVVKQAPPAFSTVGLKETQQKPKATTESDKPNLVEKSKTTELDRPNLVEESKSTYVTEKSTSLPADESVSRGEKPTVQTPSLPKNEPTTPQTPPENKQLELPNLLRESNQKEYRLIGQVFRTYWLIEMEGHLFFIDQHAAHEKVLFEQTMKQIREKQVLTQQLAPPFVVSLSIREEQVLMEQGDVLRRLGFDFESFGGREYRVNGVPSNLCGLSEAKSFVQLLDDMISERIVKEPDALLERVATISCKAAVKGNHLLSELEAKKLIDELLLLENPYHCPHGRPTTIFMSRTELEKKFKRIV